MRNRTPLLWILIAVTAVALSCPAILAQEDEVTEKPDQPIDAVGQDDAAPPADQAQADKEKTDEGTTPPKQDPPKSLFDQYGFLLLILGAFVLMILWSSRSRRKQEAKRKEMLASLKKGDKLTTIGGIVGTAIEVRDDEVVVKVDETNNVRMRFARWAVRGVGESAKTDAPAENK